MYSQKIPYIAHWVPGLNWSSARKGENKALLVITPNVAQVALGQAV